MDITIAFNYEMFLAIIATMIGLKAFLELFCGLVGAERTKLNDTYGSMEIVRFLMWAIIFGVCFLV